ncbi:MAG: hypothetical protein AB1599_05410 [Planctomycetota bacterium]
MSIKPFLGGFFQRILRNPKGFISNAVSYLNIPTYDGKNQMTHPDIICFDKPWNGFRYWMSMTPYADYDFRLENPSLVVSDDGQKWRVPEGLINPLVPAPEYEKDYNNDPELVYNDATDELYLYYQTIDTRNNLIAVRMIKSSDGVQWSKPIDIMNVPCHQWVSPSIIKQNNLFKAWTVNAGTEGLRPKSTKVEYRESTDGIQWTPSKKVALFHPEYVIWHPNVIYVQGKDEYWMVWSGYAPGRKGFALFFSTSRDGLNWTICEKPILTPSGRGHWDDKRIYRAALLYDNQNDLLRIWYSAVNRNRNWHIGYVETNYNSHITKLRKLEGLK